MFTVEGGLEGTVTPLIFCMLVRRILNVEILSMLRNFKLG
jgi:hypothetical protein